MTLRNYLLAVNRRFCYGHPHLAMKGVICGNQDIISHKRPMLLQSSQGLCQVDGRLIAAADGE
jgi:hypothetical protein